LNSAGAIRAASSAGATRSPIDSWIMSSLARTHAVAYWTALSEGTPSLVQKDAGALMNVRPPASSTWNVAGPPAMVIVESAVPSLVTWMSACSRPSWAEVYVPV